MFISFLCPIGTINYLNFNKINLYSFVMIIQQVLRMREIFSSNSDRDHTDHIFTMITTFFFYKSSHLTSLIFSNNFFP
jgi:hypothetical protein